MKYKPGNGWKKLNESVYEHHNGLRIHVLGLIRLPDLTYVECTKYPQYPEASRFIKINNNNRKRGLMAYANEINRRKQDNCK